MSFGDVVGLMAVLGTIIAVFAILAGVYKRRLDFHQRKLELTAGQHAAKTSRDAGATAELENRVRVLERIATESGIGGSDLALQIEALREPREALTQ